MPHTLAHHDSLAHDDSIADGGDDLAPGFVCSWTDGGLDAAWVQVAGELDLATVPVLVRTLRDPRLQARLVVLDLRELTFIDSAGVHAIVDASGRARRVGRRLLLLRGPPNVDRMFTLTGSFDDVEIGDVAPVPPPVQALMQLAEEGRAPSRTAAAIPSLFGPIPHRGPDGAPVMCP